MNLKADDKLPNEWKTEWINQLVDEPKKKYMDSILNEWTS